MDNTTTVPTVNRELVISSDVSEVNIVLLEDKLSVDCRNCSCIVHNITKV